MTNMQLYKNGNFVQIYERMIPAVNIQVEGVPGYLTHENGHREWYGIYFEVMFEGGEYWVVEQGFKNNLGIVQLEGVWVAEYDTQNRASVEWEGTPSYGWFAQTWDAFLEGYDCKVASKYPTTWRRLLETSMDAPRMVRGTF